MRFKVRGVWIIDTKGEFHLPIFETNYAAKMVAEALNKLAGDSE